MDTSGIVETSFRVLARARRARAFHPRGVELTGRLQLSATGSPTVSALGTGTWAVVARASKGVGTPDGWPDVRGLALGIEHETGRVDLLLTTVDDLLGVVLAPTRRWTARPYATLTPYRAGGQWVFLRLRVDDRRRPGAGDLTGLADAVAAAPVTASLQERTWAGRWRTVGRLTLETTAPGSRTVFDPVAHQHPRLRHPDLLGIVRAHAYRGSRQGRGAPRQDVSIRMEPRAPGTHPARGASSSG